MAAPADNRPWELCDFIKGYAACMFWVDDGADSSEMLPPDLTWHTLAPEHREEIEEACTNFFMGYRDLMESLVEDHAEASWERMGYDFKMTRDGHGVGFWDRGYGDAGDKLSKAANRFGSESILCYHYHVPREETKA